MDRKEALDYLNLPENATREEIRERYLELLAQYNPEQYQDPGMIQLSQRYTDDLNAAYDALTSDRFTGAQTFESAETKRTRQRSSSWQNGQRSWTRSEAPRSGQDGHWTSWQNGSLCQPRGGDSCLSTALCCGSALLFNRCCLCLPLFCR